MFLERRRGSTFKLVILQFFKKVAFNNLSSPVLILLLLSMSGTRLSAQSCDGNLGENIFLDGDFGSGEDNIVSPNPQIAPGFRYVFSGPPADGEYTLTNNTGAWPGLYQPWLAIGDNSSDPNGYLMVVNASFEPGLFYEQTIDGLCEDTQYEFSADIINLIKQGEQTPHGKPNVTFLIDDEGLFRTGFIEQTNRWNTYGFAFTTAPGQTSVRLSLSNNAPGGIGNDLGLDNISFRACGPMAQILPLAEEVGCQDGAPIELTATIDGDQYDSPALQWQQSFDAGLTWQDILGENELTYLHTDARSGRYYYRYLLANGASNLQNSKCRVVSNQKVVFIQPKFYSIIDTLCEGLSLPVGSNVYDETGTYTDSLISVYGCDSIITTELVIVPDTGIESAVTVTDPNCSYLDDGQIVASVPTGGAPPFTYRLSGDNILNGQLITDLSGGNYTYLIEDRYGCTYEEQLVVNTPPVFSIDLGRDLTLELGDAARVNLNFSGGIPQSITWNPAEAVSCDPPCTDFLLQPSNSIQILGQATSENGCLAQDSIFLQVLKVRKHFFPSAFSPNGDGVNDVFTGFGASPNVQMIEELLVFDRWGNGLFRAVDLLPNDLRAGWDGTASAKTLDAGVYVFTARIRYFDGEVEQVSGEVALVR